MRSITYKLTLSFLVIGITSICLVVLLSLWNTRQEFSRFFANRAQTDLVTTLSNYYATRGSWAHVGDLFLAPTSTTQPNREQHPIPPFTLTDEKGIVLLARDIRPIGDQLTVTELSAGIVIESAGKKVGYLLVGRAPFEGDPGAQQFIQRNTSLMLYSALGAALVALLLGLLISRTLTRPIRELTRATHAVSEGDLGQQVRVRSKDELGELAKAFNKMSSELARSVHTRRQMTADIAHELRTPLSLILGHAEAVHDGVLPPSRENFEIIREEAGRLEQLVNDLRILSLADAGELPLNPQSVSLQKLLQDLAALYQYQMQKKNITLQVDITPPLPELTIDPARMTQVFTNILDNALRHTPEGGRVTLAAQTSQSGVELSVRDSGPGLPADDLERIFDRFYRADASRTRGDGGSGLGLAIAKSIVQAHGGQIRAESATGNGLRIVITLPEPS
jgi:signal transduction histidine kinase